MVDRIAPQRRPYLKPCKLCICYVTWQNRLQMWLTLWILRWEVTLDYLGGLSLSTWFFKNRELQLEATAEMWQKGKSKRIKVQDRLPVMIQGIRDLSTTTIKNWILPITWRSFKVDFSQIASWWKPRWSTSWIHPCESSAEDPSEAA